MQTEIKALDVTQNKSLKQLLCSKTNLEQLNISLNEKLRVLWLENMPRLNKVCVWNLPFPPDGSFELRADNSPNVYFTVNCD